MIRNRRCLLLITLLLVFAILFMQGCNCEPAEHPKLSSMLNKLVQAEWRGEAEDFARPRNIELLYDDAGLVSVEVEIVCLPEKVEEAAEVVGTYGTLGVVASGSMVAIVPIASLPALADEEIIRHIRLPDPGADP